MLGMTQSVFDSVTLRFWHGGKFKFVDSGELVYLGGQGRTFEVNPDELCKWDIHELACKAGNYVDVNCVYYLLRGQSLLEGLRLIDKDASLVELGKLAMEYKTIDCYVNHDNNDPLAYNHVSSQSKILVHDTTSTSNLNPLQPSDPNCSQPCKTRENPFLRDYEWIDPRPERPIKFTELLFQSSEDEDDPLYEYEGQKDCSQLESGSDSEELDDEVFDESYVEEIELDYTHGEKLALGDDVASESDNSDEELAEAMRRVRTCTSRLTQIAEQLQKEAAEGRLDKQQNQEPRNMTEVDGYESEYYDSADDLETPPRSGDERDEREGGRRSKRGLLVSSNTDFTTFEWKVGQRFTNRDEFKSAMAKYDILQGRDITISVSNKARRQEVGVSCVSGCPFQVYGSWHSKKASFIVKRVEGQHQCHRNMKKNRQMKTTWVAKEMLDVFKARPHWPAKDIIETIKRAYKVLVTRTYAYKVKYCAHRMLHGSMQDHYFKLGRYMAALKCFSPGTIVDLVTIESTKGSHPVFQRLFTCFESLQKGWREGCRRVICVDAAFLKTFLGGQILVAVGRDANEQMFPIAWGVVEAENNMSWEWFFQHLQTCLHLGDGKGVAIISDEHQAILNGVAKVLPKAEHRHCARHVYAHWHKHFKGDEFKVAFWKIAKAYNEADYNEALESLEKLNVDAALAFKAHNPKYFCRAFMDTSIKSDAITNNMAETFNGYIINARTKHLIYMMEDIRVALMQRLVNKRKVMEKQTSVLCPRIQSILEKEKEKAAMCDVLPSTEQIFNVRYYLDQLIVNLELKSCTCKKWDMMGIPCCHALACIFFLNQEGEGYVDDCFKTEVYLKSYAGCIPPIEGERHWPRVEMKVDPPPIKVGPGRPRKSRIKDPHEDKKKPGTLSRHGMEMTCALCNAKGHNKRGCPQKGVLEPSEPPVKKPRGRPRKEAPEVNHEPSLIHHQVSAQPTQLGRGGRMILGGTGARSRATGRGSAGKGSTGRGSVSMGAVGRGSCGRGVAGRGAVRQGEVGRGGNGAACGNVGVGRGRGRWRGKTKVSAGVGVFTAQDGSQYIPGRNPIPIHVSQSSQASTIVNSTHSYFNSKLTNCILGDKESYVLSC